jgi:membrane associated rhomboid family serine protease
MYQANQAEGYSIQENFQNAPGVSLWLWPDDPANSHIRLYQFVTYQFVHSGPEPAPLIGILLPLHLIFNMLFLYVFGNAVEDRLGKVGYLAFYLAGGVLAGLAHISIGVSPGPVLGASGAVAAVTGAYLALFPLSNVTIAYWFVVFVGSFVVSSMVLILFRVIMDVIFQFGNIGNTAYIAHLAGYLFGFAVAMVLLLLRLLPRDAYDMLALVEQQRRRRQFRKLSRQGFEPWDHAAKADGVPQAGPAAAPNPADQELMARRAAITDAAGAGELPRAAELYQQLLRDRPDQVMAQQTQLDLATQLAAEGRYDLAARAYELFLDKFRDYPQRPQVQFILGLIYVNRLDQHGRGRELLQTVRPQVPADDQTLIDRALASPPA